IRVHAAGVNPVDWKFREGELGNTLTAPFILGWEVAGDIAELGSEVTTFKEGDPIFALLDFGTAGGYAEFVHATASIVARKPETIDYITAASVPMASMTAYQAIEAMNLQKDQRVLIHGAAGAVGGFAVQFARLKGAYVIALASAGDEEYLQSLQADEVRTYE